MQEKNYHNIVRACEEDLLKHGDNFLGVGWTKKKEYADLRYQVMLELIQGYSPVSLLDLGCGASHLYEFMTDRQLNHISYSGLDLSPLYLELSKSKFPHITYYSDDVLDPACSVPNHDYVVMNGLFNYRGEISHHDMWQYCKVMITRVAQMADRGFAFNVMSKHLDWERDDLFHLAFDELAYFLDKHISRYFNIRHDYGLFEYTVYVYMTPAQLRG